MPRSMTGYGAAQAAGARIRVECEIRAVNSRALKLAVRSPALLGPRDPEIEGWIRKRIRRGSVTCYLRLTFLAADDLVRLKPDAVRGFAAAIDELRRDGVVEGPLTPEALAALPGVIESGAADPLTDDDIKIVQEAVDGAVGALDTMRAREGAHLVKDLQGIIVRLRETAAAIRQRAPTVVAEYRDKLADRVAALLEGSSTTLDETTLAREVAVFADRCDITEELTRLAAHLDEFDRYLTLDEEVGRTLDFLSQELLRESNTIGSKSNDVEIARAVIALKSDVDRLKEQVANLE